MIARDTELRMHDSEHWHHHEGSAMIPANQIDGKIRTAGTFRAMYRQYRRAHTLPFFALAASRPPADQGQLRAENARLRTSPLVLTSSKIRSRRTRRSKTELGIGQPPGSSHISNERQQLRPKADFKLLSFLSVGTKQQSTGRPRYSQSLMSISLRLQS
jgi:hypothetical protein